MAEAENGAPVAWMWTAYPTYPSEMGLGTQGREQRENRRRDFTKRLNIIGSGQVSAGKIQAARRAAEKHRRGAYSKGMSTSAKLPGVAALTAATTRST